MITFQYVTPTQEEIVLMGEFRNKFENLYKEISEKIGQSRGKSLALTHLEESAMWLNKGITGNT